MPALPSGRRWAAGALLGASALVLPIGLAVVPSAVAGPVVGAPVAAAFTPAALPTSWPAVPVDQRLQPWLARTLPSASDPLRVLVSGETTAAAVAAVRAAGLTAQQTWDKAGVVVAVGTPAQVGAVVGQPGVTYVEGDQPLQYTLDTAHQATRSDQALKTYEAADGTRVDGSGVTIAVIDSGIDGTHPMFDKDGVSKVVQNRKNVCGITFIPGTNEECYQQSPANDTDNVSAGGHGTHVAGIAAGYEVTTTDPEGVALRGAAPGAKLVGLSVGAAIGLLDANSAMNWVLEHQRNPCKAASAQDEAIDPECPPIRATNHSYGPLSDDEEGTSFDPGSATVRIQRLLVDLGVTPVWAAGNSAGDGSVARTNPPAMDPTPGVLMVASYNDGQNGNRDNQLSGFSSRGKRGDPTTYPDVSAPGDLITSACRPTLAVCTGAPSYDLGNYQTISGTSMATPYVAGVVAQLAQSRPAVTPGATEELLEDTAHKFAAGGPYEADPRNADDTTSFDKGHGLVDVLAVVAAQQGLPAPAEPAPTCSDDSLQVVDPEGDATQIIIADPKAQSQPDVDVTEGFLTWDGDKKELTFHIRVLDLGGPGGDENFRFFFNRESDLEVQATARRTASGETFAIRQFDTAKSAPVTGAFDEETNEIVIVVPAETYAKVIPETTIEEGDLIGIGQLLGQRDTGVITATADTAAGTCPFTVASTGTSGPSPTPGGTAGPTVEPSPTGEPQPSEAPSGSQSPSPSGSPSPSDSQSPSPSDSPSPRPSGSASPSPSGSPSSPPQDEEVRARSIETACPEGEVPPSSQTDSDGTFHEPGIDCMLWWGIARGVSSTDYDPEVEVSRERMASFIAQLIERTGGRLPSSPPDAFVDDTGSTHEGNINKLAAAGIVEGKGEGRYAPLEAVSRASMATFLVRAYEHVSERTLVASRDYFGDDGDSVHEDSINRSAEGGFTAGRNGGYDPVPAVLRDSMATFLARVVDRLVAEGTTQPKEA